MKTFSLLVLAFLFLNGNANATEDFESEIGNENTVESTARKYTCESCQDYYAGSRYVYSLYKVYYDGKFHSNSEQFPSAGKCAVAYDSDFRCAK